MDIERGRKERQVADEPDEPRHLALPERPLPGQKPGVVQEALDDDGQRREHDGVEDAVVDAEDLRFAVLRQHEAGCDAHHEEHHGDLHIVADENEERCIAHAHRGAPHGRVPADEAYHGVPGLIEQVHAPQGYTAGEYLVVFVVHLSRDDVDEDQQNGDDVLVHGLGRMPQYF